MTTTTTGSYNFGEMLAKLKQTVPYAANALHVVLEEPLVESIDCATFFSLDDVFNRMAKQCGVVIKVDNKTGFPRYTFNLADEEVAA